MKHSRFSLSLSALTLLLPFSAVNAFGQAPTSTGMILVSDTNSSLAISVAANGFLEVVNNCTPNTTGCTWRYQKGMLVSDADSNWAINAYRGATNLGELKLVDNCTPNLTDCTWSYRNGMLVSDTNPSLAINPYGGAANDRQLRLVDNCTRNLTDCTWSLRTGLLQSDTNSSLVVTAVGGAVEGGGFD